jgi:hypothetical protein
MSHEPLLMRINDWDKHYERAGSRAVERCGYICNPNKHDSMGLATVLGEPDGRMIYGVFTLLTQRCSRQFKPNGKKSAEFIGKFDRVGWLTDNGLETGKRWTLESLARALRLPFFEIVRTVYVVSRPEVGWIDIVRGSFAYDSDGKQITINASPSTGHQSSDGQPSAEHQSSNGQPNSTIYITERTDRTDFPLSSPKGDEAEAIDRKPKAETRNAGKNRPSTDHQSNDGQPSAEHRLTDGEAMSSDSDPLQHAEAEQWFMSLFGRTKTLGYEEKRRIDALVPIDRGDYRLIDWYHHLDRDAEGWPVTPKGVRISSKPRESLGNLIESRERFQDEADKARKAQKQCSGLNGLSGEENQQIGDGWTSERKEGFVAVCGEDERFPPKFSDLGSSMCRKIDDWVDRTPTDWNRLARKIYGADLPELPPMKKDLALSVREEIEKLERQEKAKCA